MHEEASMTLKPSQVRQIFAYICIFNKPHNIKKLFSDFIDDMKEDFEDDSIDKALDQIEIILKLHGLSCTSFGLPTSKKLESPEIIDRSKKIKSIEKIIICLIMNKEVPLIKSLTLLKQAMIDVLCF